MTQCLLSTEHDVWNTESPQYMEALFLICPMLIVCYLCDQFSSYC